MTIIDLTIVNVSLPTIGRDLHFSRDQPAMGGDRVRAHVRRLPAARRPGRGSARPPPDPDGRARPCSPPRRWRARSRPATAFLIGARAVQGLGAAIMLPAALSIVMNMFEEGAERNKALGIWGGLGAARRDRRADRRRPSHPLRRLAVHLLPQRPDRRGRAGARAADRPREPARDGRAGGSTRSARSPAPAGWCCSWTRSPRRRSTAGAPRGRSRCSRRPPRCWSRSW